MTSFSVSSCISLLKLLISNCCTRYGTVMCLQCFDAVGWVAGRASVKSLSLAPGNPDWLWFYLSGAS